MRNRDLGPLGKLLHFSKIQGRMKKIPHHPWPSLQIPKCITHCKTLHINTPLRATIVRFSNKVVDSTLKRMYAEQVGLCNLKL